MPEDDKASPSRKHEHDLPYSVSFTAHGTVFEVVRFATREEAEAHARSFKRANASKKNGLDAGLPEAEGE